MGADFDWGVFFAICSGCQSDHIPAHDLEVVPQGVVAAELQAEGRRPDILHASYQSWRHIGCGGRVFHRTIETEADGKAAL